LYTGISLEGRNRSSFIGLKSFTREKGAVTQRYLTLEKFTSKNVKKQRFPKDEKAILVDLLNSLMFDYCVVFAVIVIYLYRTMSNKLWVNRYDKSSIFSSNILSPYAIQMRKVKMLNRQP